ncbi:MAG: hypothetical protein ACTSVI_08440 [Promethearchaeota archaeon]
MTHQLKNIFENLNPEEILENFNDCIGNFLSIFQNKYNNIQGTVEREDEAIFISGKGYNAFNYMFIPVLFIIFFITKFSRDSNNLFNFFNNLPFKDYDLCTYNNEALINREKFILKQIKERFNIKLNTGVFLDEDNMSLFHPSRSVRSNTYFIRNPRVVGISIILTVESQEIINLVLKLENLEYLSLEVLPKTNSYRNMEYEESIEIPKEISKLVFLKSLKMYGIKNLPEEIEELENLVRLDIIYVKDAEKNQDILKSKRIKEMYID